MTSFEFSWKNDNKPVKGLAFARKRKREPNETIVSQTPLKSKKHTKINFKKNKHNKNKITEPVDGLNDPSKILDKPSGFQKKLEVTKPESTAIEFDNHSKVTSGKTFKDKKNAVFKGKTFRDDSKFGKKINTNTGDHSQTFIKRKWKKDKIAAKKALAEGSVTNPADISKNKPPSHSLFAVGHKDVYVKSNTKAKSVVEKLFSADKKFSDLKIHRHIVSNLEKINYCALTNVQEKSIPVILKGNNVLVRSQTGSGKTLAYAIPILDSLQKIVPRVQRSDGVQAIIIVPTRELALQSHELFGKINTFQWIVAGHLCGGENRNTEKTRLRKGVHILIATPGRLLDHMLHTNAFKTHNVRCLVLDEADRLLDMGFKKDIVRIVSELDNSKLNAEYNPMALLKKKHFSDNDDEGTEPESTESPTGESMPLTDVNSKNRQTILLSATLTQGIAELADFTMKEHIYVDALEDFGTANPDMMVIPNTVQQKFIITHVKHRLFTLSALLISQARTNSKMFVFMGTSSLVDFHYELFRRFLVKLPRTRGKLKKKDIDLEDSDEDDDLAVDIEFFKLHGNMDQSNRKDVFTKFRAAKKGVLICTTRTATLTQGVAELADFTMKEHIYIDALEDFCSANPEVVPNTFPQKFIITHVKHRLFTLSALLISQARTNSKMFVFMGTSSLVDFHYELFRRFLVKLPRTRGKLKKKYIIDLEDSDGDDDLAVDIEFFKLHGNMDQSNRKDVFTKFRAAKKGVLICTDVVARGIDVPAADCIIQYNGPQSLEDYLHRVGRTGRAGKSGTAYIFLTHEEQDFVTAMEKHRVYLHKQDTDVFLKNLCQVMEEEDYEKAATVLQKHFESALENDKELHKSACSAYSSWSRFYNTYSVKMRPIFDFKKVNLGHYVSSFGLKETPTAVARIVKGQYEKKEPRRLNQKLQIHIDEDKPKRAIPMKKKFKSLSLSTSEFSSGLEPKKKRRKKDTDIDD